MPYVHSTGAAVAMTYIVDLDMTTLTVSSCGHVCIERRIAPRPYACIYPLWEDDRPCQFCKGAITTYRTCWQRSLGRRLGC